MPGRKLRDMKPDQVVRAFERAGFTLSRVAGSHYIMTRPGTSVVSIPRHTKVKIGLLLAKIKAAGMSYDEFEELL